MPSSAAASAASSLYKLPSISSRQLLRYLVRYLRSDPSSTRAVAPHARVRLPAASTPGGVGLFFYPADSWKKTRALAQGPLGETMATIHPSKIQIVRPLLLDGSSSPGPDVDADVLHWGTGGAVRVTKNLLSGVTEGFAVILELHGVGFRVEENKESNMAVFRLGYSHTIEMPMYDPERQTFFNIINPQLLQVAGVNREHVHQMAAKVRDLRKPEPYKGKGIRYKSEPVRRKETRKD